MRVELAVPPERVARSIVEFGLVPIEKPTPEISETVASRTVEPAPSASAAPEGGALPASSERRPWMAGESVR